MTDSGTMVLARISGIVRVMIVTTVIGSTMLLLVVQWLFLLSLGKRHMVGKMLGNGISDTAERLGPIFVKMAQIASHRSDILPEDLLLPLRRIQDHVRPEPFRNSRRTLELSFGTDIGQAFSTLDPNPIAAGSVATVYRACKHDGTDVAVKVVRNDVLRIIAVDLRIIRWTVLAASRLSVLKGVPVAECYGEVQSLFLAQVDMRFEASNLEAMRADQFIRHHVNVPRPHLELSSHDVLVMDFVANARNITDPRITEAAYRRSARSVLLVLYRMVFDQGFVHCDMHPGNILVADDGQVSLVDGGFFAHLGDDDRSSFRDLFLGLAYGEPDRVSSGLIRSAMMVPNDIDRHALNHDAAILVKAHHGKCAGTFLVSAFVLDLFKLQSRHRLYARSSFVAAIWAFGTFEGLVRGRMPDLDFQDEAKPFMISEIIRGMRSR